MRLTLKIWFSFLLTAFFALNTIACLLQYQRLDKDVSKWNIDSIFNNDSLIKAINDCKTIDLNNNSLHNFYELCFVNHNVKQAHIQNPNVYFLNNKAKLVYIPVLSFISQTIVNYEKHTNNGVNGLDSIEKIKANIKFKYHWPLNNGSEIYVKTNDDIKKSGLINESDIYHEGDTILDDATLLTLVFDTSSNTQGYQSVSTTLNLNLMGINGVDKYFGFQDSIKFGVTISWF